MVEKDNGGTVGMVVAIVGGVRKGGDGHRGRSSGSPAPESWGPLFLDFKSLISNLLSEQRKGLRRSTYDPILPERDCSASLPKPKEPLKMFSNKQKGKRICSEERNDKIKQRRREMYRAMPADKREKNLLQRQRASNQSRTQNPSSNFPGMVASSEFNSHLICEKLDGTPPPCPLQETGGTGKTFLYHALLAAIRSKGFVALAIASSGVATSILPGGRTAHSRFKIPIHIDGQFSCNISK
ncbi:hypothetical protein FXO38_04508 [Capsicum annuum]|nr:hypothetical protein FXO37_19595 [Capsicum annuum]KAF3676018.1 hypothetical protein FXO38_04508 [Capsicum annuum]